MSSEPGTAKLLGAVVLSASASATLTYALLRLRQQGGRRAGNARPSTDHSSCCGQAPVKRDPYDPSPRSGYLSWDDYFMAVAFLSAQRSKDPNKQVGACIVDQNQVICGIGYNGFPRGCADSELPWAKKAAGGDPLQTKYPYVCHAEMNAVLNKNGASVAGAKIYITLFPCNECAKLLIQAGIREVIFHEDKLAPERPASPSKDGFRPDQQYAASRKLLALAGVTLRQHRFRHPVTLRLTNHPAFPVIRSVDSAAVAAEAAAARAGAPAGPASAAGSSPWASPARQQQQQPVGGTTAAAALAAKAAQQDAAAVAAGSAAAAAAAAAAAVLGGLSGGMLPGAAPLAPGACPPQLLAALSQHRWQAAGAAADFAAAVNGAGANGLMPYSGGGSSTAAQLPPQQQGEQQRPVSSTASSPEKRLANGALEEDGVSSSVASAGGAGGGHAAGPPRAPAAAAAASSVGAPGPPAVAGGVEAEEDDVEEHGSQGPGGSDDSEDTAGGRPGVGSRVWEVGASEQIGFA